MTLLSAIMAATSAGEAIEVSKALVVVKKFLSDQVQVSLKMDKQAISEYLISLNIYYFPLLQVVILTIVDI